MDFKKLKIITHQTEKPEKLRAKRKGIIVHKLLSLYTPKEDLKLILKKAFLSLGEKPQEWSEEELLKPVRKVLEREEIKRWFEKEALPELELVDQEGRLHRVDRLFVDQQEVWVIEFKIGEKSPEHIEQVEEYMRLLRDIFPDKHIRGALLYVESGELTLI